MGATAEIQTEYREVYARSTTGLRDLGRVACEGSLETAEGQGIWAENWRNFVSGTEENLATDPEYGERLMFNPMRAYEVRNRQTVDKTGKPVIDMVREGYESSLLAAKNDPRFAIQAERDKGDVGVAMKVDSLEVGELLAVASMEPKEAIRQDSEFWCGGLQHYREGMAVVQVYYRKDEHTVLAGAYAVKQSNVAAMRRVFARHGKDIPADIDDNHWTRHDIRRRVANEDEARAFGPGIQEAHRRETGQAPHYSVTDLVNRHHETVQQYFNAFVIPLCKARYTGNNESALQGLAQSLLARAHVLEQEEVHQLMRIANSQNFTPDDAQFMEEKIRYALVEELRTHIPAMLAGEARQLAAVPAIEPPSQTYVTVNRHELDRIQRQAADNVAAGSSAGRIYGGCNGAGKRKGKKASEEQGSESQDVFGGRAEAQSSDNEEDESGECDYQGTFCFCCPYEEDGTPAPTPITITAHRNDKGEACCLRCSAKVDDEGNVISEGYIYKKAKRLKSLGALAKPADADPDPTEAKTDDQATRPLAETTLAA